MIRGVFLQTTITPLSSSDSGNVISTSNSEEKPFFGEWISRFARNDRGAVVHLNNKEAWQEEDTWHDKAI
jgi:hypothetical protein